MVSGVFCIALDAVPATAHGRSGDEESSAVALRQYIGSSENQLVQTAVQWVENRAQQYSPIIFYGPPGTGKTLLLRGLAHQWRAQHPRDRVVVITGADFVRAYGTAITSNSIDAFRRRYQRAHLFAIDDVQQMRRKTAAQDELACLLDRLNRRGAMVLVTTNTLPSASRAIAARLRSRLESGLLVPMTPPGPPARRLLLQRLLQLHQLQLPQRSLARLVQFATSAHLTVPQLNHLVVQLHHLVQSTSQTLDEATVRTFINSQLGKLQPSMGTIAQRVSQYFHIPVKQLRGPSQQRHIVRARGVAMNLAWNMTDKSLEAIGRYFGNRDHTTVLHACRRIEQLQREEGAIKEALYELSQQLTGTATD